jgi:hypothetical protein
MAEATLVLHCGGREVTRDELALVPCPQPEGRWRPVPHCEVLDYATTALQEAGYEIDNLRLGLTRDDQRFFGVMTLRTPLVTGTALAVGLRSSTDKSLALGFAYGSRTFVCDNLAFRSQKVVNKKAHDVRPRSLPGSHLQNIGELPQFRDMEADRIRRMQTTIIDDHFAESALLKMYQDYKILSPQTLPVALQEWREPQFHGLEERSVWRLFSAVTFALNGRAKSNPAAHLSATIKLGHLLQVDGQADPSAYEAMPG